MPRSSEPASRHRHLRTGRIKLGTESNGGFKNIAITNCVFDDCRGIAIESVDGSVIEDVAISNITMRDLVSGPLFFVLGNRLATDRDRGRRVAPGPGVQCGGVELQPALHLHHHRNPGFERQRLSDRGYQDRQLLHAAAGRRHRDGRGDRAGEFNSQTVSAYPDPRNFGVMPATGFFLRHINGLEMSHLQIANVATDIRYPFVLQDVNTSWWNGITVPWGFQPTSFGFWPIEHPQVKDFHIRSSQASMDLDIE